MAQRVINWQQRYNNMTKQRAYAWAQYYQLAQETHQRDYDNYVEIRNITTNEVDSLNEYVKKQLIDMGAELKKTWECPICLEFIEKENLDISPCGHYYCKPCLEGLKKVVDDKGLAKCAVCRHKMKGKEE